MSKTNQRVAIFCLLISTLTACVGYVRIGKTTAAEPMATTLPKSVGCESIFNLPILQDEGNLPNVDENLTDEEIVEMLSNEIIRLRNVIRTNRRQIQQDYNQYRTSCF